MQVITKHFGTIDIDEQKIITFPHGLFGFNQYKKFAIIYELTDDGEIPVINWLQSLEDKDVALPIMNPISIVPDYNPVVEDELLKPLGTWNETNIIFYTVVNAHSEVEQLTTNLKAPITINMDNFTGVQVMVENDNYPIRFNIYELLQKAKKNSKGAGEA